MFITAPRDKHMFNMIDAEDRNIGKTPLAA